jgi:DNA-binding NarL/FixJ family response regulator
MLLAAQPDMEVVGEASNGREATERAAELQPEIVVMDVSMPELNGIEATRRIARDCPKVRVLALSMHKDAVYVREILRAGARGYLLKDCGEKELITAVRGISQGQGYLSPEIADAVLDDYRKQLDPKKSIFLDHGEMEVWTAFKDGKPVGRISAQIDHDYDKTWPNEPKTAFFGFFECIDDVEVAKALLTKAEEYAKSKGRVRLRGPFTPDSKGEVGVLIEGFDTPSMIGTPWNKPFMDPLLQKAGYPRVKDLIGWFYDRNIPMDETTAKLSKKTRELPNVKIRDMELKEFRREANIIQEIYNEA